MLSRALATLALLWALPASALRAGRIKSVERRKRASHRRLQVWGGTVRRGAC